MQFPNSYHKEQQFDKNSENEKKKSQHNLTMSFQPDI